MDSDRSIPLKKSKSDIFFISGICYFLIMAFLIVVPTKTITEKIEVSYLDKETYYVNEPYDVEEAYQEKESYQDTEYSSQKTDAPAGKYWEYSFIPTGYSCSKTEFNYNSNNKLATLCIQLTRSVSTPVTKYRTITKYRTVTKYKDVPKVRDVTKTRIEPRPAEVNWVIGFKTPYTLHLPFT